MTAAAGDAIRGALEAAWAVAKGGETAVPPVPAPKAMRPLLSHARFTTAALRTIERVLDDDDVFRARVADIVDEETVGRGGWLFLTRPDGWQDELDAMASAEEQSAAARLDEVEERTARRRLKGAEDAKRRAEQANAELRAELAKAGAALSEERRARAGAEEEVAGLRRRLVSVEAERDAARRRAATADELREVVDALTAEVDALRSATTAGDEEVTSLRAALRSAETAAAERDAVRPPAVAPIDIDAVGAAIAGAARAAADLGAALAAAAGHLAGGAAEADPGGTSADGATAGGGRLVDAPTAVAPGSSSSTPSSPGRTADVGEALRRRPRHTPVRLPPAVFDDSVEAAEHLVRVNGIVILVDGYNASMAYRGDLPIAEQRTRFTDALAELAVRTGADVHVVYDGTDDKTGTDRTRRPVKVTFSPSGIEADDVILELVDDIPPRRSVLVASSDRRVQDGARERGANVISSQQLLAVLRRGG